MTVLKFTGTYTKALRVSAKTRNKSAPGPWHLQGYENKNKTICGLVLGGGRGRTHWERWLKLPRPRPSKAYKTFTTPGGILFTNKIIWEVRPLALIRSGRFCEKCLGPLKAVRSDLYIDYRLFTLDPLLDFFVDGTPRSKQSFRVSSKTREATGGRAGGYLPEVTKNWGDLVGWTAKLALRDQSLYYYPLEGPLGIHLVFYMPDLKKIDGDNLEKAVLDSLKGVLFEDDNINIIPVMYKEFYLAREVPGLEPGVRVRIFKL